MISLSPEYGEDIQLPEVPPDESCDIEPYEGLFEEEYDAALLVIFTSNPISPRDWVFLLRSNRSKNI